MDSQAVAATAADDAIAHGARARASAASLRHHFETVEQQREAASFGMWLFLLTEIMFFGGMFCAYLIYRNWYYPAFVAGIEHAAASRWARPNTAILITSGFTMAMGSGRPRCASSKALVLAR